MTQPHDSMPLASTGRTARRIAVIGLGPLTGAMATACFAFAGMLRAIGDERIAVGSIAAVLLLATLPLMLRAARIVSPARPMVLLALGLLPLTTVFVMGALHALSMPIIAWHACGTGDVGLAVLLPAVLVGLATLGSLPTQAYVNRWSPAKEALLRVAAIAALVGAGVLVLAATVTSLRRPDADHFVASLPVVARLDPGRDVRLGPTLVLEHPTAGGTQFRFEGHAPVDVGALRFLDDAHRTGVVRADGAGLFVLEVGVPLAPVTAYSTRSNTLVDLANGPLLWRRISPPRGWIGGAWIGVAIAIAAFASGARHRARSLALHAQGREGQLGTDGWITFLDGTAPRRAPDAAIAPGPVLVVTRDDEHAVPTFRHDGGLKGFEVLAGRRDEIAARVRGADAGRHAVAFASLVLTSAPLVATVIAALSAR